jgi:hypothetical protein
MCVGPCEGPSSPHACCMVGLLHVLHVLLRWRLVLG